MVYLLAAVGGAALALTSIGLYFVWLRSVWMQRIVRAVGIVLAFVVGALLLPAYFF